eukprot:3328642-Pyramimonas_sp.AAC.1
MLIGQFAAGERGWSRARTRVIDQSLSAWSPPPWLDPTTTRAWTSLDGGCGVREGGWRGWRLVFPPVCLVLAVLMVALAAQ